MFLPSLKCGKNCLFVHCESVSFGKIAVRIEMDDVKLDKKLVGSATKWCAKFRGENVDVSLMKLLDFSFLPFQIQGYYLGL